MKKTFLAFGCLLMSLEVLADDVQTVTIDGTTVNKTVTQITFSGDDVILHFSDNSTQTADMDQSINIAFQLSPTYMESLDAQRSTLNSQRVYNLRGQYMGESLEGLTPGVYIYNGKKYVVK